MAIARPPRPGRREFHPRPEQGVLPGRAPVPKRREGGPFLYSFTQPPAGRGNGVSVPEVRSLPRERQFIDNLASLQWTEFTIYQFLCPILPSGRK